MNRKPRASILEWITLFVAMFVFGAYLLAEASIIPALP